MRRSWTGYLYLIPIFVLIVGIFVWPFVNTVWYSFNRTAFGGSTDFIGLENFQKLLDDKKFWPDGVRASAIWTVGNLLMQLVIPLFIALLLNERLKGISVVRAIILIPWLIPGVVVGVMTRWLFEPSLGAVNEILVRLHLEPVFIWLQGAILDPIGITLFTDPPFIYLGQSAMAMLTLMAVNSWKFLPFGTLLLLAALQTIPVELYEAAKVDGASAFRRFMSITFPLLGGMIWFVGFIALLWNFNIFDLIWLTTKGGPGNSTLIAPALIYELAFRKSNLGQASAVAVMAAAFLITLGVIYFAVLAPKEEQA
jgi:multiple sugar transport system permease protein